MSESPPTPPTVEGYVERLVTAARADAWRSGWSAGHQVGWEHCQDGNYGTDYWDDETRVPPCPPVDHAATEVDQ